MAAEETENAKNVAPIPIDSSPSEEESSHQSESAHDEIRPSGEGDESTALMESSEERMSSPQSSKLSHVKKKNDLRAPLLMIILTFLFFIVELTFGFINGSIALLADSYHMLSDVFALSLAMGCLWIANRPSKYSTFGWVRSEVFGALINGVWLLTMCFTIALESIGRIISPRPIGHPSQVLIVGSIGLVINLIGIYVFHKAGMGHGHSHEGGGHGHAHGGGDDHHHDDEDDDDHDGHSHSGDDHGHGHSHNGGSGHRHSHDHGDGHGHGHAHDAPAHAHESDEEEEDEEVSRGARALSQASQLCHSNIALRFVNLDPADIKEEVLTVEETPKVKDKKNLNMQGAFLHIITDAVGSIIVIITAFIAIMWPDLLGGLFALYLDPILSCAMVIIISVTAVRLVRSTSEVILRLKPSFLDLEKLTEKVEEVRGVVKVNNIECWTLVANRHLSTAEIEFDSAADFANATPLIRKVFHRYGIHSLTIQPTFKSTTELE